MCQIYLKLTIKTPEPRLFLLLTWPYLISHFIDIAEFELGQKNGSFRQ